MKKSKFIGAFTNIHIYPNPVSDILHIDSHGYEIQKIYLFNSTARLKTATDIEQELDLSELETNTYFYSIYIK